MEIPVMSSEGLTPRQIRGGEYARTLQQRMGFSSDNDMVTMVRTSPINNLSIGADDLAAARRMYGQDAHSIRGKTTWSAPRSTVSDYLPVPRRIRELHETVDLAVDIFFINGRDQPMLITLARKVRLVMGQPLPNRRKSTLYAALNGIINF